MSRWRCFDLVTSSVTHRYETCAAITPWRNQLPTEKVSLLGTEWTNATTTIQLTNDRMVRIHHYLVGDVLGSKPVCFEARCAGQWSQRADEVFWRLTQSFRFCVVINGADVNDLWRSHYVKELRKDRAAESHSWTTYTKAKRHDDVDSHSHLFVPCGHVIADDVDDCLLIAARNICGRLEKRRNPATARQSRHNICSYDDDTTDIYNSLGPSHFPPPTNDKNICENASCCELRHNRDDVIRNVRHKNDENLSLNIQQIRATQHRHRCFPWNYR